jgi:aminoglycoside 3-N-acetyltransferase
MTADDIDLITPHRLGHDLRALGVRPGQVVMLHASVKAVGAVMGGPNTILTALLDVLTPAGTLMMYAGWQDIPDFIGELPPQVQALYHEQHPPFDPATARAVRENSILAEFLRTWPGSQRSLNPEASMVAVGAQAAWLTRDHPLNYGYGPGSPLAKLIEAHGYVLMLGAPLGTLTVLHFAENRARLRHKGVIRYAYPILRDGQKVWVEVEDFNTGDSHADYEFDQIALEYLASPPGRQTSQGRVGKAQAYLFEAAPLVSFAIRWLETRFGDPEHP